MTEVTFEIGQPYPGVLSGEGLKLILNPATEDNGFRMWLIVAVPGAPPPVVDALVNKPIRLGVVKHHPLLFVLLTCGPIVFDAPFCLGIEPPAQGAALREACAHPETWPAETRRDVLLVVVDTKSMLVSGLRHFTLTRSWWIAFADALKACPSDISPATNRKAIQEAYARWPDPPDMVKACTAIEDAGL